MDNTNYLLKLKSANIEIEISGPDKDFVAGEFKEIMDRLEQLEISESGLIQSTKVVTPPSITLQNSESAQSIASAPTNSSTEPSAAQSEPSQSGIAKLAMEAGVTEEEIKNIYDFKDGQIFIHKLIDGNKDSDKQRKVAKLALIANEFILNKSELSGKALGTYMRNLGIGNLGHLAANLIGDPGIYRIKNFFKLRQVGRTSALTLIKEFSKHTV